MAKISSGLTLSTDYFMRNFYKSNRTVSKKNGRSNFSKIELSYEDSRALSRAAKRMLNTDFDTDEDEDAERQPHEAEFLFHDESLLERMIVYNI